MKHILVAFDGSEPAERAFEFAARFQPPAENARGRTKPTDF